MNAEQALRLMTTQTRLELAGWRFDTRTLQGGERWCVIASKRAWGLSEIFCREERTDALAHALQYATCEQALQTANRCAASG